MDYTETMLESREIYSGRIIRVHVDEVELSDGTRSRREIVDHHGGVAVLPVDAEGYAYCVRQYRYACGRVVLEVPAGKIDRGETDPEAAMIRELKEETGYTAGSITYLGSINPSVGYSEEVIRLYLMKDLTPGETSPDDDEALEIVLMPFDEVYRMAAEGELTDAKTIAAVFMAKQKL